MIVLATLSSCAPAAVNEHDEHNSVSQDTQQSSANVKNVPGSNPVKTSETGAATALNQSNYDQTSYQKEIEALALAADNTVEDGWFYGQEPRILKSFYRKIEAAEKAKFAIVYHNWLATKNQDLVRDFASYVPYSQRADMAREYWTKNNPRFAKQEVKYQVLWVHESIQDAGELWWRAHEKLDGKSIDSGQNLAHDEEQKMLFKFMEDERSPRSLSDEVWKQTHKSKAL